MVLADPGPLPTPPSSFCPPKTPNRSHSDQTPICNGDPTPLPPGGRSCRRRSRGTGGQDWPRANTDTRRQPPQRLVFVAVPSTTGHQPSHPPTTRQPVIVCVVELGWRGTTARQTTTRAAPGRSPPTTYARWSCTCCRECELFIGTLFSNLHTSVDKRAEAA
jgi:hypothetical protein